MGLTALLAPIAVLIVSPLMLLVQAVLSLSRISSTQSATQNAQLAISNTVQQNLNYAFNVIQPIKIAKHATTMKVA